MPLWDNRKRLSRAHNLAVLSLLLAFALMMGALERMIPFQPPIPGVRLGLPNVAVLFALYCFSFVDCLMLVFMKCFLNALLAGSFVSFFYSLSGSFLSLFGMLLLIRLLRENISPIGISAAGAVLHNIGQVAAASILMRSTLVLAYLPILLISGLITGTLTGVAVEYLLRLPPVVAGMSPRYRM